MFANRAWRFSGIAGLMAALWLYFSEWLHYALSRFSPFGFDASLRFAAHQFVAQNRVPYRDFEIAYPPGILFLIGKWIPYHSIEQRSWILALVLLLIHGFIVYACAAGSEKSPAKLSLISVVILLLSLEIRKIPTDPLVLSIFFAWFALISLPQAELKIRALPCFIAACALTSVFLRWDWGLGSLCLILFMQFVNPRFKAAVVPSFLGWLTGLMLLLVYLAANGALSAAWHSLVLTNYEVTQRVHSSWVPVFWRGPHWAQNQLLYGSLFFLFAAAIGFFSRQAAVLLLPLAFLPYAVMNSDYWHHQPFYSASVFSLSLLAFQFSKTPKTLFFMTIAALALCASDFIPVKKMEGFQAGHPTQEIREAFIGCRRAVGAVQDFKSLFVVKTQERDYFSNATDLYLGFPELPPASQFTLDYRRLTVACDEERKTVDQLKKAPKPMLLFVRSDRSAPNSCGALDSYLREEKTLNRSLGSCSALGQSWRLYRYF